MLIKKKWKDKWVKALRSGKYEQAQKALHVEEDGIEKFCCLGVLCDIIDDEKWVCEDLPYSKEYSYDGKSAFPDSTLINLVKLRKADEYEVTQEFVHLAENMNDKGKTFKQIANYIEKYL